MAVAPDVVCRDWTLHQVIHFFRGVGLGQYVKVVEEHGIDGPILSELIRMDGLDDINVTNKLHKAKIYSHLRRAKCTRAEPSHSSSSATGEFKHVGVLATTQKKDSTAQIPEDGARRHEFALEKNQARKRRERLRKDSSHNEKSSHQDTKRLVVRPSSESDAWTPSCCFAPQHLAPEVRMQIFDFVPLVELFRLTCTARALREEVLREEGRLRRLCSDVNFAAFGDTMLLCLRTVSSMARYNLRARRPRGSRALEDVGERLVGLLRVPVLSTLIRRLDLSEAPADLVRSEVLWQAIEQLEYLVEVEYPSLGWPDATERRRFEGALARLVERNKQRAPDSSTPISVRVSSVGEACSRGSTSFLV